MNILIFCIVLNITVISSLTIPQLFQMVGKALVPSNEGLPILGPILLNPVMKMFNRRRRSGSGGGAILGVPTRPEHLPEAEPILPGHTLIRPAHGMLKSAVKYPLKERAGTGAVYGNLDNVGIRYGNENYYTLYTSFRKALEKALKDAKKDLRRKSTHRHLHDRQNANQNQIALIILPNRASKPKYNSNKMEATVILPNHEGTPPEEYVDYKKSRNAFVKRPWKYMNIISDDETIRTRRHRRPTKPNLRTDSLEDSLDSSRDSEDSDEKNPGNPYTIHKNKYKQNWLWNYEMTGDHMNVNPYAPSLVDTGPVTDVFFGRKWWYFNQDDYLPLRR